MTDDGVTLVCVDLDGTCVRYIPRLEIDPEFLEALVPWLARGRRWIMNSDRPVEHMREIASYLAPAEQPAALLCRQRDIFLRTDAGRYREHTAWNRSMAEIQHRLWAAIRPQLAAWEAILEREFAVEERFVAGDTFAFRVPREESDALRARMGTFLAPWPEAQVSGNDAWSFVLHASFSKRRVLEEAARLLCVEGHEILAIGDGLNDLSMLDGSFAWHVGCPADAHPTVQHAVRAAGGHVASLPGPAGSLEILRALGSGLHTPRAGRTC